MHMNSYNRNKNLSFMFTTCYLFFLIIITLVLSYWLFGVINISSLVGIHESLKFKKYSSEIRTHLDLVEGQPRFGAIFVLSIALFYHRVEADYPTARLVLCVPHDRASLLCTSCKMIWFTYRIYFCSNICLFKVSL